MRSSVTPYDTATLGSAVNAVICPVSGFTKRYAGAYSPAGTVMSLLSVPDTNTLNAFVRYPMVVGTRFLPFNGCKSSSVVTPLALGAGVVNVTLPRRPDRRKRDDIADERRGGRQNGKRPRRTDLPRICCSIPQTHSLGVGWNDFPLCPRRVMFFAYAVHAATCAVVKVLYASVARENAERAPVCAVVARVHRHGAGAGNGSLPPFLDRPGSRCCPGTRQTWDSV